MIKRTILALGVTSVSVAASYACAQEVRMVEVNGRQVRVHTDGLENAGSAGPIVVFEAGFMHDGLSAWTTIIGDVARFAPVIAYDRAGIGESEPDGVRPTPKHVASNLHELLEVLDANPPYVLVGHSLGGPLIRMYTALYPEDVAGLVFIDPAQTLSEEMQRRMDEAEGLSPEGSQRLRESWREMTANFTPSIRAEAEVMLDLTERHWPAFQVLPPMADIPVSVLMSTQYEATPSHGVERSCEPQECHSRRMQVRMAWMSTLIDDVTNGTFTVVTNSGHFIQYDDPDLVVAQIRRVLEPKPPTRVRVDVPETVLAEYVGRYDSRAGQFELTLENGQLFAQLADQQALAIYAESETEFFYRVVDAQITFVRDADGVVTGLVLHQNGRDLRFEKVP